MELRRRRAGAAARKIRVHESAHVGLCGCAVCGLLNTFCKGHLSADGELWPEDRRGKNMIDQTVFEKL